MKFKFLLSLLLLMCTCNISWGVQIVYPKTPNVTINSDKTFFVGNESPSKTLKINNEIVKLHSSGGFKHVVKLNPGQNVFIIDNGESRQVYKITRPKISGNVNNNSFKYIKYENPFVIEITKDNTPLRSTPVDKGFNRLQHLNSGIKFEAIAEERGFYKVKLGRDGYGYICKEYAKKTDKLNLESAHFVSAVYKHDKNNKYLEISLDKQVPYSVTDSEFGLDIVLYNTDTPYEIYEGHIDGKSFGYTSYYRDNETLVVLMKEHPKIDKSKPFKKIRITIDPGHGGNELGAIGCLGTKEKDVNLEIALNLKNKLEKLGAIVNMTRDDDSYVGLKERVDKSNYFDSDIFLSIHNNSLPDSLADKDASGTYTYYFYPQSRELAKVLLNSISQKTGFRENRTIGQSFAVIRNTQSLAVLLEIGYLINPEDNFKLINKDFQNKITDGIIDGLEKYLTNDLQK